MKFRFLVVFLITGIVFGANFVSAETTATANEILLWPNAAPGSENLKIEEKIVERSNDATVKDRAIIGISKPSIIPLFPEKNKANGVAVLICPGGAYQRVVLDKEGYDIGKWLNSIGITAFILKYRLPAEGHGAGYNVPLQDAQRALRIIKKNAALWGIDPKKIGVIGFSAGGHVASTLGTHYASKVYPPVDEADTLDCRPSFMILGYPVISMKPELTHSVSRDSLIGKTPSSELVNQFSNEINVDANTPPTFIMQANDDVLTNGSLAFYSALRKANVSAEIHIFRLGGHGFGIRQAIGPVGLWTKLCEEWLVGSKIITR